MEICADPAHAAFGRGDWRAGTGGQDGGGAGAGFREGEGGMSSHFQFQFPWVLALLALLPVYAFLRGRVGKLSALRFPSAEIARAAGGAARGAAGRLLLFLRLLTLALCIVALAGPRFANDRTETQASGVDI